MICAKNCECTEVAILKTIVLTNTPLSSVLLQTCASNAQHQFVLCTSTSCDILYQSV